MDFFSETQMVAVSFIDQDGWWIRNGEVHVSKGTSLPPECIATIYTPSAQGMIGRFNNEAGTWVERKDNRGTPFWSIYGDQFVIDTPDGEVGIDFVTVEPPEYDHEKQEILFENGAWKIFEIRISQKYWDADQNEYLVSARYWECPANHTVNEPPTAESGFGIKLINGEWVALVDHRNKIFWDTETMEVHTVSELGVEPEPGWTEKEPIANSKWDGNDWIIEFDLWLDNVVRPERDRRLAACDYVMMPDYPIELTKRTEWEDYRSQLRDLPATLKAVVEFIPWPTEPF